MFYCVRACSLWDSHGSHTPVADLSSWPWRRLCWGRPAASCRTPHSAPYPQPRRSPPSETSPPPSPEPPLGPWGHTGKQVRQLESVSAVIYFQFGWNPPYLAPMGMTPLDPTPTGMWSNRDWASCSFTGCTSRSSRFVLRRRTPQFMSKPTPPAGALVIRRTDSWSGHWRSVCPKIEPHKKCDIKSKPGHKKRIENTPGDTTASGSSMSKAAMFPMANPYPEWTSGRPMDLCGTIRNTSSTFPVTQQQKVQNNLQSFYWACRSSHEWFQAALLHFQSVSWLEGNLPHLDKIKLKNKTQDMLVELTLLVLTVNADLLLDRHYAAPRTSASPGNHSRRKLLQPERKRRHFTSSCVPLIDFRNCTFCVFRILLHIFRELFVSPVLEFIFALCWLMQLTSSQKGVNILSYILYEVLN